MVKKIMWVLTLCVILFCAACDMESDDTENNVIARVEKDNGGTVEFISPEPGMVVLTIHETDTEEVENSVPPENVLEYYTQLTGQEPPLELVKAVSGEPEDDEAYDTEDDEYEESAESQTGSDIGSDIDFAEVDEILPANPGPSYKIHDSAHTLEKDIYYTEREFFEKYVEPEIRLHDDVFIWLDERGSKRFTTHHRVRRLQSILNIKDGGKMKRRLRYKKNRKWRTAHQDKESIGYGIHKVYVYTTWPNKKKMRHILQEADGKNDRYHLMITAY